MKDTGNPVQEAILVLGRRGYIFHMHSSQRLPNGEV